MKYWVVYLISLFAIECKNRNSNNVVLHYDFYCNDRLGKANGLTIEYKKPDTGFARKVNITSNIDSTQITFAERITANGIYRSIDNSPFSLTHSFNMMKEIESNLPKSHPYFINKLTKEYKVKNYSFDKDSIELIFFDEAIPWYSYTNSYYSKQLEAFLIFYDPRKDCYFKLAKAEGLQVDIDDVVKVENKILRDTSFFGKFLKDTLPKIPPPPLK